jgi:hypothetical protein
VAGGRPINGSALVLAQVAALTAQQPLQNVAAR